MSRLERQPLRGEKMDEEDRTGDLVEAATLELEAMVEGAGGVMALSGPGGEVMKVLQKNGVGEMRGMEVFPTYRDALALMHQAKNGKSL